MIRAANNPVRPGSHARPANPGQAGGAGRPAEDEPADVYVYRDTGEAPGAAATAAPGQGPDVRDASYWYDLSGADRPPVPAETRGPFEPLVSSSDPPRMTSVPAPEPGPAPDSSAAQGPDSAPGRTSKLEQIREFYLTAEAIGEQNVDKHFDQLLAQQRELIGEYFKQPPAAAQAGADQDGAVTPDHPGAPGDPGGAGSAGGQADAAHGASVAAEQPRVW